MQQLTQRELAKREKMLKKKFTTLTRVMSPRNDICVKIKGDRAYTDYQDVVFPIGDFSDPDYLELLEGCPDHEIGHVKHSSPKAVEQAKKLSEFLNGLRNAIEDVRMERLVMEEWPGAKINLAKLVRQAIKRGWFAVPDAKAPPPSLLQAYILYYGRFTYCDNVELKEHQKQASLLLEKALGSELFGGVKALMDTIPVLKTPFDSLELAKQIMALLKMEYEKPQQPPENQSQQPQQQQSEQSGSNSSGGSAKSEGESQGDQSSGSQQTSEANESSSNEQGSGSERSDQQGTQSKGNESSQTGEQSDGKQSESKSDGQSSDAGQPGSDGSQTSGNDSSQSGQASSDKQSGQASNQQNQQSGQPDHNGSAGRQAGSGCSEQEADKQAFLNACLSQTGAALPDMHELAYKALEQHAKEAQQQSSVSYLDNHPYSVRRLGTGFADMLDEVTARFSSSRVKQPLSRVLYDLNRQRVQYAKRGVDIDCKRLAGVASGNHYVFKTERITKAPNTAISIIVDKSGSMRNACTVGGFEKPQDWKMKTANTAAYALAKGVDGIKGSKSEVLYYPYTNNELHLAKSYDEKPNQRHFCVKAGGGTPTAEAMYASMKRLAFRPEPKKMMFIITDGQPSSPDLVNQMMLDAQALGIIVLAFGIGTRDLRGFGEHSVFIDDPSLLHLAVKDAIQSNLLTKGA